MEGRVPQHVQKLAASLDCDDDDDAGEDEAPFESFDLKVPQGRSRAARRVAAKVRAKLGLPKRTEANRLVAGRMIRDELVELGVRPSHIMRIEPIALYLVFKPIEEDILGRQLDASAVAGAARAEFGTDWYSEDHPTGWRAWIPWSVLPAPVRRLVCGRQRRYAPGWA